VTGRQLNRVVIALLGVALAAACGATVVPSVGPERSDGVPASHATPTTFESAGPAESSCPEPPTGNGVDISASFQARLTSAGGTLTLVSARRLDGTGDVTEYGPPPFRWPAGLVKGGDAIEVFIKAPSHVGPFVATSVAGSLRLADGRILPVGVELAPLVMSIPDVNGSGTLDLSMTWVDDCYEYRASIAFEVTIASSVAVDSCPVGDALAEAMRSHDGALVDIAGVQRPFNITEFQERYGNGGGFSDGAPLFGFSDQTPVIGAASAASLRYEIVDPEIRLVDARADFYARDAVLDHTVGEPSYWAHRTAGNPTTTFELAVPSKAGRYAVMATFGWELRCAFGSAYALIGVDVE
jgi:hypothetical protein